MPATTVATSAKNESIPDSDVIISFTGSSQTLTHSGGEDKVDIISE